ncbi:hypothetical protein V1477_014476 [Vespula maculifrons]|uniref:Uncharacterized protein n=1 Tax=Vespula maculifrons TaxID=7453 RepID=A0ABD2BHW9_VESMC
MLSNKPILLKIILNKNKNTPGNYINNSFMHSRFEIIVNLTDNNSMEIESKLKKAQSIVIPNVSNIQKLFEMLANLAVNYIYKIEGNSSVRIHPETISDYRKIK